MYYNEYQKKFGEAILMFYIKIIYYTFYNNVFLFYVKMFSSSSFDIMQSGLDFLVPKGILLLQYTHQWLCWSEDWGYLLVTWTPHVSESPNDSISLVWSWLIQICTKILVMIFLWIIELSKKNFFFTFCPFRIKWQNICNNMFLFKMKK